MRSVRYILWIVLLACNTVLHAQNRFEGVLVNRLDSAVVADAVIYLSENNRTAITDNKGRFSFVVASSGPVTLHVLALGCDTTIVYHDKPDSCVRIYVGISPNVLPEAKIVGLSAEEVVRKAVALIPVNYADSSYCAYSSYRQYQKVNGKFCNLVEAKPAVMFKIAKERKKLVAREALAVNQLRRSEFHQNPSHPYSDNPADLFIENPVYHLFESSLNTARFIGYFFSFDTVGKTATDYSIKYVCPRSSRETHGIQNAIAGFLGESWEHGKLIIDRESFAIKRIEREGIRNGSYTYPKRNNLVLPDRKYFCDFIDGSLIVQYELANGKWYLKQLLHKYTNEFYSAAFNSRDFVITSYVEWYADSNSRFIADDLRDRFYYNMQMADIPYDGQFWKSNNFPFYFGSAADVYRDIAENGPLERQFLQSSKVTTR